MNRQGVSRIAPESRFADELHSAIIRHSGFAVGHIAPELALQVLRITNRLVMHCLVKDPILVMFTEWDEDKDGRISTDELQLGVALLLRQASPLFFTRPPFP